jgi:hypothetical protein
MSLKHIFVLELVFLLSACQAPVTATPGLTPAAIQVYYPASLQAWADKLARCASENPQVALYLFPSTSPANDPGRNVIVLEVGQPEGALASAYPALIGWEQVVVIANQANPVSMLTAERLRQILSGSVTQWDSGPEHSIQVWVLPEGDPARQIFDNALALGLPLSSGTQLAPDPGAMLEAVSADEGALGYLPASFLSSAGTPNAYAVKIVLLEQPLEQALHQPVLALTQREPTADVRGLIVCAENSSTK